MASAVLKQNLVGSAVAPDPIVIVGTGPVGVRTVQELMRANPGQEIVIYGDEPWEPYNRVRLTQMLAGHSTWADVFKSLTLPDVPNLEKRYNCPIVEIDRHARIAVDSLGYRQRYSKLVLAVGSRPHVPNISGVSLDGVFTFRNMSDVQGLLARRVRSRKTLVIGGGLLGIEAAKALQRSHIEVSVIEHGSRLMERQLDERAGELICEHLTDLGIKSYLGDSVKEITGDRLVEGVRLRSGTELSFDTVVIATGIIPNTKLARDIGISVGRGIRVNDQLQTSDENIYAVGECTEHRGQVYGLVAPGLEQASVAAHSMLGKKANYKGSISAANLKVVGKKVFSIGRVTEETITNIDQIVEYGEASSGEYRKLVLRQHKLVGAIAIGEWDEVSRLQEGVTFRRQVWPWQLLRFKRTGKLWPAQASDDVRQWPAMAAVCNCTGVTRGALSAAIAGGCQTVESLAECTGASSVCGSCKPKLAQLVGAAAEPVVDKGRDALFATSFLGLIAALLIFVVSPIAFPSSVQLGWHLSELWSDGFYKQVTGFTLLGLSVVAMLLSLRKRIKKFSLMEFGYWRVMHAVLGVLTLAVLLLHTGMSMGQNLNFMLMFCFVGLALVGAFAAAMTAYESGKASLVLGRWRRCTTWAHIFLFWPLPVLLGFHILKSYYF